MNAPSFCILDHVTQNGQKNRDSKSTQFVNYIVTMIGDIAIFLIWKNLFVMFNLIRNHVIRRVSKQSYALSGILIRNNKADNRFRAALNRRPLLILGFSLIILGTILHIYPFCYSQLVNLEFRRCIMDNSLEFERLELLPKGVWICQVDKGKTN